MKMCKCDRCGKIGDVPTQLSAVPHRWRAIVFTYNHKGQRMVYDLCPTCCTALKIKSVGAEVDIKDRLLEIIEEIVSQQVNE